MELKVVGIVSAFTVVAVLCKVAKHVEKKERERK